MKPLYAILLIAFWVAFSNAGYRSDIRGTDEHIEESGALKDVGGKRVLVKSGEFDFKDPAQVPVNERWSADEKGFKAEGNFVPTSPPIPSAIKEALRKEGVKPPFGPGSK